MKVSEAKKIKKIFEYTEEMKKNQTLEIIYFWKDQKLELHHHQSRSHCVFSLLSFCGKNIKQVNSVCLGQVELCKIGSRVFQENLSYVEIEEHGIGALRTRHRGCTKKGTRQRVNRRGDRRWWRSWPRVFGLWREALWWFIPNLSKNSGTRVRQAEDKRTRKIVLKQANKNIG